jgi:hypothetical protein
LLQHYNRAANNQGNNMPIYSNQAGNISDLDYQRALQIKIIQQQQQQRQYQEWLLQEQRKREIQAQIESNRRQAMNQSMNPGNSHQAYQHMTAEEKHILAQQARMQLQRNNQVGLRTHLLNEHRSSSNNQITSTSRNQASPSAQPRPSTSLNSINTQNRNSLLAQTLNPASHRMQQQGQQQPSSANQRK